MPNLVVECEKIIFISDQFNNQVVQKIYARLRNNNYLETMSSLEKDPIVTMGANDKHWQFRSCVGVQIISPQRVEFTLGTRVHCKNLFGQFYMGAIDRVHRSYVTPTMLRMAVDHAFPA